MQRNEKLLLRAVIALPERQNAIRLRSGRSLAWSEWGPEGGLPVLFCTGAALSGVLGFGTDCLAEFHLRLIAVDRPGLGNSDPHPAKTLTTWVTDIAELVAANSLRKPVAVGFSQGAPFALALAAHHLVGAVAIVSGEDELAHPAILPRLHPDVRQMVDRALANAEEFEDWFARQASADGLWQLIIGTSCGRDRELYLSQPFREIFARAVREGFRQGPAGYARDLVNTLSRWTIQPEQIQVPVHLWFGRQDTSPVHSPDFGATLFKRLPNATHVVDPDEGGSILWTRARDILADLTG